MGEWREEGGNSCGVSSSDALDEAISLRSQPLGFNNVGS